MEVDINSPLACPVHGGLRVSCAKCKAARELAKAEKEAKPATRRRCGSN